MTFFRFNRFFRFSELASNPDYKQLLVDGTHEMGLELNDKQVNCLLAYHALLVKWNKAYNLTAVRDPVEMISRHLLDSLSIADYLQGERFIDVGTGAGLPGLILAIVFPHKQFDLLDSAGKKMRFLFQTKIDLGLENISIHNCRVENFTPDSLFDGVISRAFASVSDMVACSQHLLAADGLFYCMKGKYPAEEIEQLKKLSKTGKSFMVEACHGLRVPGEDGERHLLLISSTEARP